MMDPHTLETYRQQLLALQQQLLHRIFDMEESMRTMDADRDIERTDRVQEEAAEVALTALDEQGRREMEAIQAALAHIDAGTYGICETCGETISAARLTARPGTSLCVVSGTARTQQDTGVEERVASPGGAGTLARQPARQGRSVRHAGCLGAVYLP